MTTGWRVRQLRTAVGVAQDTLAKRSGYSRETLSTLERDLHEPRESTLAAVAGALGVAPDALTDDDACLRELARIMGRPAPTVVQARPLSTEQIAVLARAIAQVVKSSQGSSLGFDADAAGVTYSAEADGLAKRIEEAAEAELRRR